MNLIRWNNQPTYSNLFDQLFSENFRDYSNNYQKPAANIEELEDKFKINLAIPGVSKKDIDINIEDNVLTISSDKETSKEDQNFTRREFEYHSFSRSFTLPKTIEQDKIKADYKNGILELTLPKIAETKLKKVINIA